MRSSPTIFWISRHFSVLASPTISKKSWEGTLLKAGFYPAKTFNTQDLLGLDNIPYLTFPNLTFPKPANLTIQSEVTKHYPLGYPLILPNHLPPLFKFWVPNNERTKKNSTSFTMIHGTNETFSPFQKHLKKPHSQNRHHCWVSMLWYCQVSEPQILRLSTIDMNVLLSLLNRPFKAHP